MPLAPGVRSEGVYARQHHGSNLVKPSRIMEVLTWASLIGNMIMMIMMMMVVVMMMMIMMICKTTVFLRVRNPYVQP